MVDAAAVTKPSVSVKFLCSYGGKILPRHPDGKLRYHGGHTRLLSVHRSVSFSELLAKMGDLCGSEEVTLRCQLPTEDLDALVSIKSDEDLANLIEEYDLAASPSQTLKIRAFLFVPKSSPRSVVSPNGSRSALARSALPPLPSGGRRRCVHQAPMMTPVAPIWYEKPTSKVARHVPRNSGHELTAEENGYVVHLYDYTLLNLDLCYSFSFLMFMIMHNSDEKLNRLRGHPTHLASPRLKFPNVGAVKSSKLVGDKLPMWG
ncbi:PAL OF QUIRKY-like protein [Drosera capensis]